MTIKSFQRIQRYKHSEQRNQMLNCKIPQTTTHSHKAGETGKVSSRSRGVKASASPPILLLSGDTGEATWSRTLVIPALACRALTWMGDGSSFLKLPTSPSQGRSTASDQVREVVLRADLPLFFCTTWLRALRAQKMVQQVKYLLCELRA